MAMSFLTVSLLIFWFSGLLTCYGKNTAAPTRQLISINQTITSTAEKFVLGFFSPGNSTFRYLGIWYSKIPQQTVIWVANRATPIRDSSAVLCLSSHGNLVVMEQKQNTVLWSSNVSSLADGTNTSAVLLDNGNLVLIHGNGSVIWQSFDHPTNTFLPGMRIKLNLKTNETTRFTSWELDGENPAPGEFTLGIDPKGPASQLMIWRNSTTPYWRSGIWSGSRFFGSTQVSNYLSYLTITVNEDEVYITVTNSDTNYIVSRFMVDGLGRILQLSWNYSSRKWDQLLLQPLTSCDSYGWCGVSGSCFDEGARSSCRCLEGYEANGQKDWENGNWSGGCRRKRNPLECEKGERFLKMEQMKLPDFPIVVESGSDQRGCEAHCLGLCSCTAYSFSNVSISRCLIWTEELIDLREGIAYGDSVKIVELSKKRYWITVILPAVLSSMLILGASAYTLWRRTKMGATFHWFNLATRGAPTKGFDTIERGENIQELPLFPFQTIVVATDNFSFANKLGEGGFGMVYRGRLEEGEEIAVKRLSRGSGQGLEELKNEVELIAKLQHTNLVRLLGWCIHGEEKMLIYEYMPNTSLDKVLFDANQKAVLDWRKRFGIIEGIAQGLLYLHRYSRLRVIHRDLKPSNILLDGAMNPKISDFGLARIFGGNQTEASTNKVVGTYGYMSPEYTLNGLFSEKSDVFSYGVIVIEIVCGKRSTGFYPSNNSINFIGYVWQLWSEGREIELMDPSLGDTFVSHEVTKCICVGLLCVQDKAKDRPTMSTVVAMLSSESTSLPSPTRPAFYLGSTPIGSSMYCSNEATVSQVEAR